MLIAEPGQGALMRQWIRIAIVLTCLGVPWSAQCGPRVETEHLIVEDVQQQFAAPELQQFAARAEAAFVNAATFWSAPPMQGGKVIVELHRQRGKHAFSVFQQERIAGERRNYVRVYGVGSPQEMVHKLTHALFPTEDKLIRNMMGIPTEARYGNPQSFPMCGHDLDAWVTAVRRTGSYLPLHELGERHEDWGMAFEGKLPVVSDRRRQHASYAEAGSFGNFLLKRFGAGTVKEFHRAARQEQRPWRKVFGGDLPALEAEWLASLEGATASVRGQADTLAGYWTANPATACERAQAASARK
jgi:hypothetical protein